jgi:aspartate racemase
VFAELRRFLRQKLPAYMVPSSFVLLEQLPLTPNGKINRRALPPPDDSLPLVQATPLVMSVPVSREMSNGQPRNAVEARLVEIWQELLSVPSIGVHDNFFELGGHSLLAVRLFALIEQEFQKVLPLAQLFQTPTIAHLASALRGTETSKQGATIEHFAESLTHGAAGRSLVEIQAGGRQAPLFLLHHLGGQVFCYNQLARYLGGDQPVYAFNNPAQHATPTMPRWKRWPLPTSKNCSPFKPKSLFS